MVSISSRLFFSLLLIGTLLIPIKTIGQTTGIQEAESFLSTKSLKIPNGAQIAVALVSDTTFQTFGLRSENNQIISTLNDSVLFEIGSITKVMTAMLLMDFIIKDSISLHEKIEPYLPADFPKNDLQHVGSISFQELATHQSGLHRDPLKTKQYIRLSSNPWVHFNRQELINDLVNAKLKASGKYRYSNIGYILLGLLLEEIGKDSYASLLQNTILNRAMMPHTSLSTANTATGGFNVKGKQVDNWTLDTAAPAGGVVSCTADIAKFLSWTMDSSNELTRTCIEPINKGMINGTLFSYIGLGWNITETGLFKRYTYEDNLIWHNGSTAGFQSYIGFLQKRKIGVVVLTNFRSKTLHAIKLGEHMLSSLVENREGEK